MNNYLEHFRYAVVALLGGVEMASEFFSIHPELIVELRVSAAFHCGKGGAPCKGARIFFDRELRPMLAADRAWAARSRIGSIDDVLGQHH